MEDKNNEVERTRGNIPRCHTRSIKWNVDAEEIVDYFKSDIKKDFGTLGNFFDAAVKRAIRSQYGKRIPVFLLPKMEYSAIEFFKYRDKQRERLAKNSRDWKRRKRLEDRIKESLDNKVSRRG